MAPTVALQAGGFLVFVGFVLGALGLGPQAVAAVALPGAAVLVALAARSDAALRRVPVPVRTRRRTGDR